MNRCWSFDHGTEGWVAEAGMQVAFSHDDASGDPASGSLSVTNQDVGKDVEMETAAAYQCLPVPYADKYTVEVAAIVPSQPVVGGASIQLVFVNTLGCQGVVLGQPQFADTKPLSWASIKANGDVPRGTRSAVFRLLVGKFHNDPAFMARFDHIRLNFE